MRPHARLLIAGVGEQNKLAEALERLHPATVTWMRLVADLRPIYAAADCNLITSSSEGLSNTLLEGLASGLPAVVSAIAENLDVGGGGPFLIPFRQESVESLVEALVEAIDRGPQLDELGTAARACAISGYDLADTARQWGDLYRSLVDTGRARVSTFAPPSQ